MYNFTGCNAAEPHKKLQQQMNDYELAGEISLQFEASQWKSARTWHSAHKHAILLYKALHLPALNAFIRATSMTASWSRKLSSAIIQTTSRTVMKVRR